ncbi:hypothetical protein [Glaciimonas soli]|uniref:Uncharacterized protein n=1 Tax=Glaciimonas soli TaxID=2590999 RepID=A0A843YUS8_9BURK|nr:hypothetical protein [Glaciimonas soli]MQR00992.1 hypothetical protein [Glaciimonas soli]
MIEIQEVAQRFWTDLISRPSGPMAFRFYLQPVMGLVVAWLDGVKDARTGRTPFFWTILHEPAERVGRILEGLKSTSRIIGLGVVMEAIYQYKMGTFHVLEALNVVFFLAVLPYLLFRGPVARIAKYWIAKKKNNNLP